MGDRVPADRALVVGLGRSGLAAAESLLAAGVDVIATDARADVTGVGALRRGGATVRLGVDGPALVELLDEVDLVVPSPGVSERAPVLRRAVDLDLRIWSEPELGWRLHPCEVVAITGTNGKTSVTELTAAILASDGRDAVACGNIGHPFTVAARQAGPDTVLVAELSSFQLRYAWALRPHVGVLLNLAPDHLDWHVDAAAYAAAKTRMWQAQQPGDWAVGNLEDPPSAALVRSHAPHATAWFSHLRTPATGVGPRDDTLVARLPERDGALVEVAAVRSRGPHHVANVAAAACAALLAGAATPSIAEGVQRWRPGRHRLEVVATA
ncbi:MAG TPA: UDP-N-acetylmuramoyl-L-alanine--D-glutamate ligase, partial [Nitriliruptorales bacterium]|nr:UDP-N-acetylmuramoyl-L-alanine--D-glutamate ligase [Nitriliruptorales bacterium]